MNRKLALFVLINACIIICLAYSVMSSGSCKAPILIFFYYPLLILADFITNLVVRRKNKELGRLMLKVIFALMLLFIPFLAIVSSIE